MPNDAAKSLGWSNYALRALPSHDPWIWPGVLAEKAVTLLSAPEKIGKTTLVSLLLDRRRAGGQLLGRAVRPGRSVLCTEEDDQLWMMRQPPLDFGPNLIFHRPGGGFPSRRAWRKFIDDLLEFDSDDHPVDLLVIDTAAAFMPLADRNRRVLRWALGQLTLVADDFASVLIVNQSRNMHRPLAAFADIVIEMGSPGRSDVGQRSRRRTITGVGRYPGTLETVHAELNAEGTDYVLVPADAPAPPPLLDTVRLLLAESATPLTRHELLTRWPGNPPSEETLWRTLTRGVESGLLARTGSGTKTEAFRYGLASEVKAPDLAAG